MSTLTSTFYLALSKKKIGVYTNGRLNGRLSMKPPALARGEIAMKLSVEVPAGLFEIPALRATVRVPNEAVSPPSIDATVIDNVQELLRERTGLDVVVTLSGADGNG
jgi:hypothetical protein